MQNKVTETHPQSGPVKRLSLAGAKPLKLTTLTKLSAVFPGAQKSQSEGKKAAEIEASGTQNRQKGRTNEHPQKQIRARPGKECDLISYPLNKGLLRLVANT